MVIVMADSDVSDSDDRVRSDSDGRVMSDSHV